MADILLGDLRDIWRDNKDAAEALENKVATQSELEAVKSELETIKANQTNGDQKVQQTGSIVEEVFREESDVENWIVSYDRAILGAGEDASYNSESIDISAYKYVSFLVENETDFEIEIHELALTNYEKRLTSSIPTLGRDLQFQENETIPAGSRFSFAPHEEAGEDTFLYTHIALEMKNIPDEGEGTVYWGVDGQRY